MPFPDDLLKPIEGSNPSGLNLRDDPLFAEIEEARREEAVRAWHDASERDRKVADNPLVIKLSSEALATKSKDLWLAAWLTESLLKQRGYEGLRDGLTICGGLLEKFWETLYPQPEDGDLELRAAPLDYIGKALTIAAMNVPIVEKGTHGLADYKYAREKVRYEGQVKSDDDKKSRAQAVKEGKLTPEGFDNLFETSSKAFYATTEGLLDECLQALRSVRKSCEVKFPDPEVRPSTIALKETLEYARQVVDGFLRKKREKEPDPVEEAPVEAAAEAVSNVAGGPSPGPARAGVLISLEGSSEPADRLDAIRKVAEAAAFLREREPHSPAAYLMLRGLRWGELRAAASQSDPTRLEAPPTELRRHLKRLALDKKWEELLEAAERAMALPCSRAWLDLQRVVVEACEALGGNYDAIARAIRSELKALITEIPQLLDASLMDDTPAANPETRRWLMALLTEAVPRPASGPPAPDAVPDSNGFAARWPGKPADGYEIALRALREGQEAKAFEILQRDIIQQRSGRERFRRKLQLVEMCVSAQKQDIAQPILDDLAAAVEAHKLDDWEDPAMVAGALAAIMKLSQKIQADQAQRQRLFERICRLDPAKALG